MLTLITFLLFWNLFHVDFADSPLLVQLGEVDNHVFTVVAVTATRCLTSGQSTGHDCITPLTHDELSSECTAGPLRLSHPHLEVGRGARQVVSGDCEGERRLYCVWHTSLDDQSGHPAVLSWMWKPVTVARVKPVAGSFCQRQTCSIVGVVQENRHLLLDRRLQCVLSKHCETTKILIKTILMVTNCGSCVRVCRHRKESAFQVLSVQE